MTTEIVLAVGFTVMGFSCSILAIATKWQEKKLNPTTSRVSLSENLNKQEN